MKLLAAALLVYAAGILLGIPMAWAVNERLNPLIGVPIALVLAAGGLSSAMLYLPR